MDFAAISSALSGLKTATEIAKYISDLDKGVEVNGKIIELQGVILTLQASLLDVQAGYAHLAEENDALRKQLDTLRTAQTIKEQYELVELEQGKFVYALVSEGNQPKHWLCTNCFDKDRRSILQMYTNNGHGRYYRCPNCNDRMSLSPRRAQ